MKTNFHKIWLSGETLIRFGSDRVVMQMMNLGHLVCAFEMPKAAMIPILFGQDVTWEINGGWRQWRRNWREAVKADKP
jgi:hypothetical protein